MDFFGIFDGDKSYYVYIKDFDRFMFHKTKHKNRKHFCISCLHCCSSKNVLTEYKTVCLTINGAQSVRLEKRINEFKNLFKQLLVPFKVDSDFESILNKKYQDHISCSSTHKLVCVDDKFSKPVVVYSSESDTYKFIEAILEEYEYCKQVMKKNCKKIDLDLAEEETFH